MMLRIVMFAMMLVIAVSVGLAVLDENQERFERAALAQAEAACNANLPGDGWTIENRTVNTSELSGVQEVLCSRNGSIRMVRVEIEVNLAS